MKKILISFFLLSVAFMGWSQILPVDKNTNKVTFIENIAAPGMSVADLEKVVKEYMKEKPYTVTTEEAGGKIIYQAFVNVSHPKKDGGFEEGKVNFSYSIFFKEGKYRIIMADFTHEGEGKAPDGGALEATSAECGPTKMTAKAWVTIKKRTNALIEQEIADLKQKVLEVQNDPANNDDW